MYFGKRHNRAVAQRAKSGTIPMYQKTTEIVA